MKKEFVFSMPSFKFKRCAKCGNWYFQSDGCPFCSWIYYKKDGENK